MLIFKSSRKIGLLEEKGSFPMRSWLMTLTTLLPLLLMSLAVSAEGFPHPLVSQDVAFISFGLAVIIAVLLLAKRWMTIELFLFSFLPYSLLVAFDEISTAYKTPFIFLCALILTAGAIFYRHSRASRSWRDLILLLTAAAALVMAWHAASNFWQMAADLGYVRCFPDAFGCAPLTGQETPWWVLFFKL